MIETGLIVKLSLETHGGRDETYLAAIDHFDKFFESGWRMTYVSQELEDDGVNDVDRIPTDDRWDVEYQAIGQLRRA